MAPGGVEVEVAEGRSVVGRSQSRSRRGRCRGQSPRFSASLIG
jgi:hypothetical protein